MPRENGDAPPVTASAVDKTRRVYIFPRGPVGLGHVEHHGSMLRMCLYMCNVYDIILDQLLKLLQSRKAWLKERKIC